MKCGREGLFGEVEAGEEGVDLGGGIGELLILAVELLLVGGDLLLHKVDELGHPGGTAEHIDLLDGLGGLWLGKLGRGGCGDNFCDWSQIRGSAEHGAVTEDEIVGVELGKCVEDRGDCFATWLA